MNSQREAFEKANEAPEQVWWSTACNRYVGSNELAAERYQGKWEGWQAATEQGEPSGVWQFYQSGEWRVGSNTHNHRENTEGAGIPTRDLYTHPPKPTGGGVPDTYSNEFNDAAWVFVESLPEPKDRAWAASASIKPALRAFVDALLATQQPPEQE